jgi:large subunit ribosomal protein L9
MKVILKEDVNKLGRKGELHEVADGYGRNYLVARGLAEEATAGKIRALEEHKKTKRAKSARLAKEAEGFKRKINGKVVTVSVTAGEGGRLFGSVTNAQIAEAVDAQYGIKVDKKDVKTEEAVKQAGDYPVKIKLYAGVEADMTMRVEALKA